MLHVPWSTFEKFCWMPHWILYFFFHLDRAQHSCSMTEVSRLWLISQVQPIACFSVVYGLRVGFVFYTLKTVQKRTFFHNNYLKIRSQYLHQVLLEHSHTRCNVLSVVAFLLQWQIQIVAVKIIWPLKAKTFTIWTFTKKVCQSLLCGLLMAKEVFRDCANIQYYLQIQWIIAMFVS